MKAQRTNGQTDVRTINELEERRRYDTDHFILICMYYTEKGKDRRPGEEEGEINGKRGNEKRRKRRNKKSCSEEKEITQEVISRTFTRFLLLLLLLLLRFGLKIEAPCDQQQRAGFPVAILSESLACMRMQEMGDCVSSRDHAYHHSSTLT